MADSGISLMKMAFEYILIVIFFIAVISFVHIRNNYADSFNTKEVTETQMQEALEFNKYNTTGVLTGDAVIEAIRNYKDGRIEIYVSKPGVSPIWLTATSNASNNALFTTANLEKYISPKDHYKVYLSYDSTNLSTVKSVQTPGIEITGIAFVYSY